MMMLHSLRPYDYMKIVCPSAGACTCAGAHIPVGRDASASTSSNASCYHKADYGFCAAGSRHDCTHGCSTGQPGAKYHPQQQASSIGCT